MCSSFIINQQSARSVTAGKFDKCLFFLSIFLARKLIIGIIIRQVSLNTTGNIIIPKLKKTSLCSIIYSSVAQPFYTRGTLNIVEESWRHTNPILHIVGGGGDGLWH
jgi:hypothetical protein